MLPPPISSPFPPRIALIAADAGGAGHGLIDALAALPGGEIGNVARLEASPSALLPYFAQPAFFEGHDVAIFDTAAMDQNFLWAGAIDPYSVLRWLEAGIAAAHRAGCIPVVLVTPHLGAIPAPGAPVFPPPLQQLYRATALRSGALCFDLFDCVARRLAATPADRATIFAASDRLAPEFLGEVARWLLDRIGALRDLRPDRRPILAALPQFARVPLAAASPTQEEHPEGRLRVEAFARVEEHPIDLAVGDTVRLVGVLVDRASPGMLRVVGEGALVKAIGGGGGPGTRFAPQLIPFTSEVRDFHGMVRIAAAPAGSAPTEPSWNARTAGPAGMRVRELLVERAPIEVRFDRPILPRAFQQTDWSQPL